MQHARLWSQIWRLGTWIAARRPVRVRDEDVARHLYRAQIRGMGLRMTEWLRDRLRPRWLRIQNHHDDERSS